MKPTTLLVVSLLLFTTIQGSEKNWETISTGNGLYGTNVEKKIIATINEPVGLIVKEIVGNLFDTFVIIPSGVDPHSFSLTPDIVYMLESSVLIVLIDPENFQIEKSIISNDQLKHKPFLSRINYTDYGWEYYQLYNIGENFHGSWLRPENGLAIAKALVAYLSNKYPAYNETLYENLLRFQREINSFKEEAYSLANIYDARKTRALLLIPGVFYVVNAVGITVNGLLMSGEESFPSSNKLAEVESELKNGIYNLIVAPIENRGDRIGQLAEQLSKETGVPVAYIVTFSSYDLGSYTDILRFDMGILFGLTGKKIEGKGTFGLNDYIYLAAIAVLSTMVFVEAYIIYRYRKAEFELFLEGD